MSSATIIEATVQSEERLFFEVGSHTFIVTSGYAAFEGVQRSRRRERGRFAALCEAHLVIGPSARNPARFAARDHLRLNHPDSDRMTDSGWEAWDCSWDASSPDSTTCRPATNVCY